MDKDVFTLIGRADEKLKLWQDLAQAKGELLCKGQEDVICKLRVVTFNTKTQSLECIFESSTKLKNHEEYLGHFFLGGEKYYFQAIALLNPGSVSIPLPQELYHLQRRQSFRARIPASYSASYNITHINGDTQKIPGKVIDISSQGCRALYNIDGAIVNTGASINGVLLLQKKDPIEIQGIIRHIKIDDENKKIQSLGIEFTPLPSVVENKLFAVTMEIHKEFFRRPK